MPLDTTAAALLALVLIALTWLIFSRRSSAPSDRPRMKAVYYHHHFGRVIVGELPRPPSPGPGQLLVKVHAASLNPADWKQAAGETAPLLPFRWPRVYGFDFSGVVEEAGPNDGRAADCTFAVGQRIFGMIRGLPQRDTGTLAEYVLVDADVCASCPPNLSHAECASVPLVAITAVRALRACGLAEQPTASGSGPRVLVTGGAGGVGSIAQQLARHMFGAAEVEACALPCSSSIPSRSSASAATTSVSSTPALATTSISSSLLFQ
jgi:NADPH:quinone reductase-like Zn-dependent oxidoreductase